MNYYRFLDSRDIRNHLEEMEYPLSTPEAAYMVWQCRGATLEEKFAAWEEIIQTMPDCAMEERLNMAAIPSFHGFLREYMETSRKLLKLLQTSDLPCAYQWVYREERNPNGYDRFHGGSYETYETCVKAAMDVIKSQQWMPENIPLSLEIVKAGPGNDSIHAFLNREGVPLSVGCCGGILSQREQEVLWAFSGMWFDFPTPFQRGDILIQKAPPYLHVQRPCDSLRRYFVLESLAPWDNSQMAERGFSPGELSGCEYDRIVKRLRDHGDYTDMSFLACFLEGGNLVWDNRSWYLSLERHTGPLPENQRLLGSVSDTIQGRSGLREFLKDLGVWEVRRITRRWGIDPEELFKKNV